MDNPIVMYLVVRESLKMSIGKTAAQVAHAAQRLQQSFSEKVIYASSDFWETHNLPENIQYSIDIYNKWLNSSVRKVVLKADEKEWQKLISDLDWLHYPYHLVIDEGYTEVSPNTATVIGLWPTFKEDAPKIIKRLQVL